MWSFSMYLDVVLNGPLFNVLHSMLSCLIALDLSLAAQKGLRMELKATHNFADTKVNSVGHACIESVSSDESTNMD